jgi:hypothetical protein
LTPEEKREKKYHEDIKKLLHRILDAMAEIKRLAHQPFALEVHNLPSSDDDTHAANTDEKQILGAASSEPLTPRAVIKFHDPDKKKKETRERWTFIVTIGTAVIILIYTTVAALQWYALLDTNRIARDTFNAANRPYVGVNTVSVFHMGPDSKGNMVTSRDRTPQTTMLVFTVEIKNFGTAPALNAREDWRAFVDGVEQGRSEVPASATTHFPTESTYLKGLIGTTDYRAIVESTKALEFQVTMGYDWPLHHEEECAKYRYNPTTNMFMSLGACTFK